MKWPIFAFLLLLAARTAVAQDRYYPPGYRQLRTDAERIRLLKTAAGDSNATSQYTYVPMWSHTALDLIQASGTGDTLRSIFYQYLGDAYDGRLSDSAAHYYRLALATLKQPPSTRKRIYLQQSLLYVYMALDQKDSILYYTRALERTIAPLPDTSHTKMVAMNTVANGYSNSNLYQQAINTYRTVIRNAGRLHDSTALRNALVNIGSEYNEISDNRMAVYYTLQALPLIGNEPVASFTIYTNLSSYFMGLNHADSAELFLRKAEAIAAETKDSDFIHVAIMLRGGQHLLRKNYSAAAPLLQQSLDHYSRGAPSGNLVNCLIIYAALDTAVNNYPRAEQHLRMLYDVTSRMNHKAYLMENLRLLAAVNEHIGDYKDAYRFLQLYQAAADSMKIDKAEQSFAALQAEYQTYKKVEEINLLKKEGLIKDLQLGAARRNKALMLGAIVLLVAVFGAILYNRSLRNKVRLESVKAGLEMKSLRSQMNPHFIFNSLNSIQKYIWENRQEDAAAYLTKFARLIRLVLENSRHESIRLKEELEALRLYIEMEQRRNNQKFDYRIRVDPALDPERIMIPPLLLQPYAENAIWHGLSQKEGRGLLTIALERAGDTLRCTIDDDGIGRAAAAVLRRERDPGKSLGMNISAQRIAWLQQEGGAQASVALIDKSEAGHAAGTTVIISLPIMEAQ